MTLDEVFDNFVRQINTALPPTSTQPLRTDLEAQAQREALQRKLDALTRQLRAEKQPRRQLELYQKINHLKSQLQG